MIGLISESRCSNYMYNYCCRQRAKCERYPKHLEWTKAWLIKTLSHLSPHLSQLKGRSSSKIQQESPNSNCEASGKCQIGSPTRSPSLMRNWGTGSHTMTTLSLRFCLVLVVQWCAMQVSFFWCWCTSQANRGAVAESRTSLFAFLLHHTDWSQMIHFFHEHSMSLLATFLQHARKSHHSFELFSERVKGVGTGLARSHQQPWVSSLAVLKEKTIAANLVCNGLSNIYISCAGAGGAKAPYTTWWESYARFVTHCRWLLAQTYYWMPLPFKEVLSNQM